MKWWDQMLWSSFSECFKPTFSLCSFTFIKRLFSSSSLSALRVVSSAYLTLLIFLPALLIPKCCINSFKMFSEVSGIPGSDLRLDLWFVSYTVQILMQGKNPGIAWKYALPKVTNGTLPASKRHSYAWSTVQTDCSVSCGGGRFPNSVFHVFS